MLWYSDIFPISFEKDVFQELDCFQVVSLFKDIFVK